MARSVEWLEERTLDREKTSLRNPEVSQTCLPGERSGRPEITAGRASDERPILGSSRVEWE